MVSGMNTSSAMSAFERMEEKVMLQEARAQSMGELAGADLESQFARLESGSDVDDELAALKASLAPAPEPKLLTPEQPSTASPAQPTSTAKPAEPVDRDLEALKKAPYSLSPYAYSLRDHVGVIRQATANTNHPISVLLAFYQVVTKKLGLKPRPSRTAFV
jgi:PspA/IM30 family